MLLSEGKVLVAVMDYGVVPMKVNLVWKPMQLKESRQYGHINVQYPTKGWQLIRVFAGEKLGTNLFEHTSPEGWVEYLDDYGDYSRYSLGPNGVSMFLPMN